MSDTLKAPLVADEKLTASPKLQSEEIPSQPNDTSPELPQVNDEWKNSSDSLGQSDGAYDDAAFIQRGGSVDSSLYTLDSKSGSSSLCDSTMTTDGPSPSIDTSLNSATANKKKKKHQQIYNQVKNAPKAGWNEIHDVGKKFGGAFVHGVNRSRSISPQNRTNQSANQRSDSVDKNSHLTDDDKRSGRLFPHKKFHLVPGRSSRRTARAVTPVPPSSMDQLDGPSNDKLSLLQMGLDVNGQPIQVNSRHVPVSVSDKPSTLSPGAYQGASDGSTPTDSYADQEGASSLPLNDKRNLPVDGHDLSSRLAAQKLQDNNDDPTNRNYSLNRTTSTATTYEDALSRVASQYEQPHAFDNDQETQANTNANVNTNANTNASANIKSNTIPLSSTDLDTSSGSTTVNSSLQGSPQVGKTKHIQLPPDSGSSAAAARASNVKRSQSTKSAGRFSGLKHMLRGDSANSAMVPGSVRLADTVPNMDLSIHNSNDPIQAQLGPWGFGDDHYAALEDSTFIFTEPDHPRSVAQRRHYFADKNAREQFVYDPSTIYTASFFAPFFDFNTFDMNMGPISINVSPWFQDMPIRYTLRSTRLDPKHDNREVEYFVTISFQLVDE